MGLDRVYNMSLTWIECVVCYREPLQLNLSMGLSVCLPLHSEFPRESGRQKTCWTFSSRRAGLLLSRPHSAWGRFCLCWREWWGRVSRRCLGDAAVGHRRGLHLSALQHPPPPLSQISMHRRIREDVPFPGCSGCPSCSCISTNSVSWPAPVGFASTESPAPLLSGTATEGASAVSRGCATPPEASIAVAGRMLLLLSRSSSCCCSPAACWAPGADGRCGPSLALLLPATIAGAAAPATGCAWRRVSDRDVLCLSSSSAIRLFCPRLTIHVSPFATTIFLT